MPRQNPKSSTWSRVARRKGPPPGSFTLPYGAGPWFSDAFRFRRAPSPVALVEQFKSLVYMCCWKNANGVARVPLRLYVVTKQGQEKPKWWNHPKQVHGITRKRLNAIPYISKAMAGADNLDEVTKSPILDLLHNVCEEMDQTMLIQYLSICLDLFGTAYIWPLMSGKIPQELWALPPQYVYPMVRENGMFPDSYTFGSITYRADELIRFRRLAPKNPYGIGLGAVEASVEYARLEDVFVALQDNMLSNGPRPSMLVSLKDGKSGFGPAERKRLEDDMERKGRGGRSGGVFVVDAPVSVTPMSYSPTDLAGLKVAEYNMDRIAGIFDIPLPLLTRDTNLANMQAARELHERDAIDPRCKAIASTLTRWIHSLDPTGEKGWNRLIFAFDSAVSADNAAEAELHKTYVDMGVWTRNEVRLELGYDAVEDGDVLLVPNNLVPLSHAVEPPAPPEPPTPPGGKPDEAEEDVEDKPADEEEQAEDVEAEDDTEDQDTKALDDLHDHLDQALWDVQLKHLKLGQHEEAERLGELLEKAPCRDENGRFASCGGGTGTKPKKPGKKPGKPSKKPATSKPKDPKPEKPKPATKPKPADKPKPASKPKPAEKPAKPTKPPKESAKPAEPKPKPEKPAPKLKPEKPAKPAEKPASKPEPYREFRETNEGMRQANDWGMKASKDWAESLTPAEANAMKEYGVNTYGVLNASLRGKSWKEIKADAWTFVPEGMTAAKAKAQLRDAKSAMNKASLPENVMLFRGVKHREKLGIDLDNLKPGAIITEKGFSSTSLDRQLAAEFAGPSQILKSNLIMRIKAPKGTKGAYLDAGGLATYKEAREVVLAPGQKYRYLGKSKMAGVAGDTDVIDLEIVP